MFKTLLAAALLCAMFGVLPNRAQAQDNTAQVQNVNVVDQADAGTPDAAQPKTEKPKHHVFQMQDNMFSYQYGATFRDPFIATVTGVDANHNPIYKPRNIAKNIVEFKHIDIGNKFGDNTFVMSYLQSNRQNPTSVAYFHDSETVGAKDVYMVYRHSISLARLFPNKDFTLGPIKDVTIVMGADFGSKNDDFANQRRSPMVGPGLAFKVPNHGYANVAVMWTREWNNEGTDVTAFRYEVVNPYYTEAIPTKWGQKIVYDPTYSIQANWGVPFRIGKAPFTFEGFGTFNGAKGYGAPELVPYSDLYGEAAWTRKGTKPETILHSMINYNVGSLFGEGHNWQIGFGYEYWNNMFGVDHHKYPTCVGNTPFLNITIHL